MYDHGIKHDRSQQLIDYACEFAAEAHGEQKRKYTGEPYVVHPIAVAQIVASVTTCCDTISAAFLHDVVEDTPVTIDEIKEAGFCNYVAQMVGDVTDVSRPEDGNREIRKALDREHLANATPGGKTIKLADIIHNTKCICTNDKNFAKVYMSEIVKLMPYLIDGDKTLYIRAMNQIIEYYHQRARSAEGELKCRS